MRACRSSNDCGNYAGPITLSVEIPIQPPAVVASLTVSPTTSTNGAFTLSWPPSTGATRYRITETINGGEATYYLPAATATNPETYAFSNRGNGVYVYTIAACKTGAAPPCSIDGMAQATVTVAVANGIAAPLWIQGPSSLPGVGCVEVGGGASYSFDIDWQSVAGATRYEVVEGDDQNGTYPNNPILVTPTSNPTFQRLHLTRSRAGNAEITYNYGVRACNATSCSEERRTAYMCLNSPGGPLRPLATTGVRYLHTDALGSPVAETDEFGTLVKRTRYEPYGAPTDGVYVNGPGFTGHVTDAATGLTYMQQRYYDPMAGQFLSLDPVAVDNGSGGNFNRYWYANNNPYRFTDPDGREVCGKDTTCRLGNGAFGSSSADLPDSQIAGDEASQIAAEVRRDFIGKQAEGARAVADGASAVADVVDEEAVATVKYGWIGGVAGRVLGKISRFFRLSSEVPFRSNTSHIFRNADGHFTHDTAANRTLLQSAVRPENLTRTEGPGGSVSLYRQLLPDGRQIWVKVKGGEITNGGINATPLP